MANVVNIQEYGNQLAMIYDDGSKKLAYPTGLGVWLVGGAGTAPEPPPDPSSDPFIWPFSLSLVTSEYGPRWGRLHAGIDFGKGIANVAGTPVKAAGAGKVIVANNTNSHGGYGNAVVLDHGGGRCTLYGHLQSLSVAMNQTVTKSQTLGGVGNSGASQGVHLHFETHEGGYRWNTSSRDPRLMMKKWNS